MTRITTIGLDIAKSIFQVHAIDASNQVVIAKAMRRAQVLVFFAKLEPCLVGIEACGSGHFWAREIGKLGHTVKLMPPKYVKPYVKRGKTDAGDAEAICEAVTRPTMTFVAVKSAEQQALAMLHKVRETLIGQRTQAINALRGHLSELGVIAPLGLTGLAELTAIIRDAGDARLPPMARGTLELLLAQIEATGKRIAETDAALRAEHKSSAASRALETVPSIGPVIASALRARIADARVFENGRHMAAWIGLVPEQNSSGGKTRQRGISKKGDQYLRRLLVSGAMAMVQHAQKKPDKYPWIAKLLGSKPPKLVAVAVANKTARTAWAIMAGGGTYDPGFHAKRTAPTALAAPV
jgi:transposase